MRYLQCQQVEIDTKNRLINRDGEVITLAPKVYDLLMYFCEHNQRVITRDELMDNVWAGTLVTDNAISRTLVEVRKALGDAPKSPKFIITVPRRGYRMSEAFIANDQSLFQSGESCDPLAAQASGSASSNNRYFTISIKIIMLLTVVMVLLMLYWFTANDSPTQTKQIKALTREVSQELFPATSPDLTHLAYTKISEDNSKILVIENLISHQKTLIAKPGTDISKLVWSSNNKQVAFLAQSAQSCMIYLAELSSIEDTDSWRSLTRCGDNSSPHFVFSPDGKSFFFNDRLTNDSGYQIFRIGLEGEQKEILNQPITTGRGNYSFDVSPNGKALVMLNSEYKPKTSIYTLNFKSSELQKTAELDYLMRSVVYHHDGQSIVHPSPHPAYELWQSSLAGEKLSVVVSNTSRVKHVSRLNNEKDFVFVSYLLNRDIHYQASDEASKLLEQVVANNNSSVMDYLPALTNSSNSYAFVSKRTSTAQVYLVEETPDGMAQPIQLTNFQHNIKLYHLAFSPSDRQLLILADNQIFIADLESKVVEKLPLTGLSIQGSSWQTDEMLLFTTIENNRHQLARYHLASDTLTTVVENYHGGLFIPEQQIFALISQNSNQIEFVSEQGDVVKSSPMSCQPAMQSRKINLHLVNNHLLCFSGEKGTLEALALDTNHVTDWRNLPETFDVSVNLSGILYTEMKQSIADVMRTTSE